MSNKASWAATAANSVILARDTNRGEVVIQFLAGSRVYFGFGEAAEVGKGLFLDTPGSCLTVNENRAIKVVHAICVAGGTAEGGIQFG
jgi:hypothetical protein